MEYNIWSHSWWQLWTKMFKQRARQGREVEDCKVANPKKLSIQLKRLVKRENELPTILIIHKLFKSFFICWFPQRFYSFSLTFMTINDESLGF